MDEVLSSLEVFQKDLESFNDKLQSSFQALCNSHEKVNVHWQDSMRHEYDSRWTQLHNRMQQYVNVDGNNYTEILIHKVNILRRYLYGY